MTHRKMRRKVYRNPAGVDPAYATEIRLFLDNEHALYTRKMRDFLPNVARKMISGKYDASLAYKLWLYLVDDAVRSYDKQFGSGRGSLEAVNKPTREAVAKELASDEAAALRNGEYGDLYTLAGRKPPKSR